MRYTHLLSLMLLALLMSVTTVGAQSVTVQLSDGSRWRGDVGDQVDVTFTERGSTIEIVGELVKVEDLYIRVDGKIGNIDSQRIIFKADLVSMETIEQGSPAVEPRSGDKPQGGTVEAPKGGEASSRTRDRDGADEAAEAKGQGVFLLPLEGPVGETFRHDEIEKIGKHADKFGPGQIIVLVIESNGGLVFESEKIVKEIQDIKQRHRVVAWIEKAISAGAVTAMACNEIYFRTYGTCGSVTTITGSGEVTEAEQLEHTERLVDIATQSGYSEHIARSMKMNRFMCSYDKDPVTGEVTFYGDMSGEFLLSDNKSNLTFNSSEAEHCGFSKGTADTTEELAKLLDLPEWHEVDDYGRQIASEWKNTAERANKEISRLLARLDYYKSGTGDPVAILSARIKIFEELIRWIDRAPLIAVQRGLDRKYLERLIEETRRQLRQYAGNNR